jgi:hypothetical protein
MLSNILCKPLYSLLFILICLTSCKGQTNTPAEQKVETKTKPAKFAKKI